MPMPKANADGAEHEPRLQTPVAVERPELFFALVGPIGTDLDHVCEVLAGELGSLGYETTLIKLSSCLHRLGPYEALRDTGAATEHIIGHMDAGDELRRQLRHGGALAALAVAEVKRLRESSESRPTAFIFRSLKHPDEVELLRAIYGSLLFVVSLYEDAERRRSRLERRLERDAPDTAPADAEKLMRRDETGTGDDRLGQDVQNTFPKADYFLDGGRRIDQEIKRCVRLVFGDHEQGPTRSEYAMAMAHVAARRSSDLSRQVGAAIVDPDGEVLALGCNEVPRHGGGVYWSGDDPDGRAVSQEPRSRALSRSHSLGRRSGCQAARVSLVHWSLAGSIPRVVQLRQEEGWRRLCREVRYEGGNPASSQLRLCSSHARSQAL